MAATFEIVKDALGQLGIRCKLCNKISWNQRDVDQEYCGNCHYFHSELSSDDFQP